MAKGIVGAEDCAALLEKLVTTNTCQPEGNEEKLGQMIADLFPDTVERSWPWPGQSGAAYSR